MKKIEEVEYDRLERGMTFIFTYDPELLVKTSAGHIDSNFEHYEGDFYISDSVIPITNAKIDWSYWDGGDK